ncbi:carboxylesterase 1C [Parasteatoda tepidariorum]|uniref:carboxylesterase 1C n=1 Tax=Parasteatoda tepidariorum TaxID=114398 RepID=UPI001C71DB64|nr:neuroligin-4, X-linked [Parasteatoda tepidariorum]
MKTNSYFRLATFTVILYHILFVKVFTQEYGYDKREYKYYTDQNGRLYTKYFSYSSTEFEHAVDDSRCDGRPPILEIVKETRYGNFKGRQVSLCDSPGVLLNQRPGRQNSFGRKNTVNVFLGIPYAEPPLHRNSPPGRREEPKYPFKSPVGPVRVGELDTSRYKPACPQNERYLVKGRGTNHSDEDCLYLNIFSPAQIRLDMPVREKFPVMFYIHGGRWDHGSGSLFPGQMLAASQRVVVVTFNYRLGYSGFLATGDHHSPGNYGMLDQIKALEWVYENIPVFEGDPTKITVFGSGVGGASAALLAISPLSRRMVKRVIAQNGSPLADWAAITDPIYMFNSTQILAEELGCSNPDMARIVECVGTRTNNEVKLLKMKPRVGWLPFGPVLDNFTRDAEHQFLPLSPQEMLERGLLFNDGFAYMTGVSRDAGASILWHDSLGDIEIDEETFNQKIREFMRMYNYTINAQGIYEAIRFMYKPSVDSRNKTLLKQQFIQLLTDRYYVSPLDPTLQLMLKNKVPTYAYVLNYTFQGYTFLAKDVVSMQVEDLLLTGAPFMDPKFYPEYLRLNTAQWTEEDRNMSQLMMEAWANFAKEGNPTPRRLFNTILWEPVSENNYVYLNLNASNTTSRMINDYRNRESRFWNYFLPFFIDREPPTLAPTLEPGVNELRVVTSALWGSVAVAALLLTITLVFCLLYCKVRSKKPAVNPDLNTSRETFVNCSTSVQDTPV